MSRIKKFAHALLSGYVLLGANIGFTLFSVPLALHYLSKPEFALWALTSQIAGYVALIELGMSGSVSRILIDYKDEANGTNYGSVIQTGFLVGLIQGVIVLAAGTGLVYVLGPVLKIPTELERDFRFVMLGQCALLVVNFWTRILGNLLWAHQYQAVYNYAQTVLFAVNLGILGLCFHNGLGVYSMLWGQAGGVAVGTVVSAVACIQLRLLPRKGRWGFPSWSRFWELFVFGRDVFLFSLGSQMVNATQTILIAPCLGLEAAAVWSICTRLYVVICQLVWRIFDFAATPLSEMWVRGERDRLFRRFRSIANLSASAAVVTAVLFAVCNQPFVNIWTNGKIGWSPVNDLLLGVWSVLMAIQRCHCGLLGVTKNLGTVKYIYFGEGALFICLALCFGSRGGFPAIILSSVIATLLFSFSFGLWRTKSAFRLTWSGVVKDWLAPAGRIAAVLVPWAALLWLGASHFPAGLRLLLLGGGTGAMGALLLWRHGLEFDLQAEIMGWLPSWLQPVMRVLCPSKRV